MLFNSYEFIFLFLPLVYAGYLLLSRWSLQMAACGWLVLASLFFYGWWNPAYLVLIVASTLFNFVLGNSIATRADRPAAKRLCTAGIIANLGLLAYYKYMNFFIDSANVVLGTDWQIDTIVLPLAISFFTFQQISYLADAYSGTTREPSLLRYALFVTFFPQLIAGPIVHHKEMLPQFAHNPLKNNASRHLAVGVTLFLIGLFKKVVLADSVAVYASPVFNAAEAGETLSFFEAWGGALAYTLQIYFDFSGYSDMAIGVARMFGIVLPLNFHSPYKSRSIVEFWRSWHMTLSRFLRDYVYIPLGGNRHGPNRRQLNLMIVMLVGGLWHGAGWTFVIWGGLHGCYLMVNHFWSEWAWRHRGWRFNNSAAWKLAAWLFTFIAVVFAWVFFRAESFAAAVHMCYAMVNVQNMELPAHYASLLASIGVDGWFQFGKATYFPGAVGWAMMLGLVVVCVLMPNSQQLLAREQPALDFKPARSWADWYQHLTWRPTVSVALLLFMVATISFTLMTGVSEFLYFQF